MSATHTTNTLISSLLTITPVLAPTGRVAFRIQIAQTPEGYRLRSAYGYALAKSSFESHHKLAEQLGASGEESSTLLLNPSALAILETVVERDTGFQTAANVVHVAAALNIAELRTSLAADDRIGQSVRPGDDVAFISVAADDPTLELGVVVRIEDEHLVVRAAGIEHNVPAAQLIKISQTKG